MKTVPAPASLLKDPALSAAAKIVWLAGRGTNQPGPTALQVACGLSPNTIRRALAELSKSSYHPQPGDQSVPIPATLLANREVGAHAKLLYGLLQLTPASISYADLSQLTHTSINTVRLAVTELEGTNWLNLSRTKKNQLPHFTLRNPELDRQRTELALARGRLAKPGYSKGEKLMRELLSLVVDSTESADDTGPEFLVNPQTGERLRFDRYYPPSVAFEYQGPQHYGPTEWYPSDEEAKEQQLRDLIKAGICFYRGITLVLIHPEDLSLEGMRRKVGALLPLKDLNGHEPLASYLERVTLQYRHSARLPTPTQ